MNFSYRNKKPDKLKIAGFNIFNDWRLEISVNIKGF